MIVLFLNCRFGVYFCFMFFYRLDIRCGFFFDIDDYIMYVRVCWEEMGKVWKLFLNE